MIYLLNRFSLFLLYLIIYHSCTKTYLNFCKQTHLALSLILFIFQEKQNQTYEKIVAIDFQIYFKSFQITNNNLSSISLETLKQNQDYISTVTQIHQQQSCRLRPLCFCNCQLLTQITRQTWIILWCKTVVSCVLCPCT